jgi:acyl carrier protein
MIKEIIQGGNNVDNEQVEARIKKVFIQELGLSDEQYTLDAIISDDLGADSLDRVELIMGMEEEFDINISDEEAEKALTVNDAIRLVKRYLHENPCTGA